MSEYFEEYIDYIKTFHKEAADITEAKARDYAGYDEPMRNFIDSANMAGVTVEQGLLVRMCDKISRTRQLTESGSLVGHVGEKLSDTLKDLSNYASILDYWCQNNYNGEAVNQLKLPLEPLPEIPKKTTEQIEQEKKDWFTKYILNK